MTETLYNIYFHSTTNFNQFCCVDNADVFLAGKHGLLFVLWHYRGKNGQSVFHF